MQRKGWQNGRVGGLIGDLAGFQVGLIFTLGPATHLCGSRRGVDNTYFVVGGGGGGAGPVAAGGRH